MNQLMNQLINLLIHKTTFLTTGENFTLVQIIQWVAASSGIHAGASSVVTFFAPVIVDSAG